MPHFDLLNPPPPPKFYQLFLEFLDKIKTDIDDLQKEKFATKAIYTILEQQKNVKPKAEKCWSALGHNVPSWASVWNSCFDGPSLGRENDISFLISHRVVKMGTYLTFKCNMTAVNELCTICNTSDDTEQPLLELYFRCAYLGALSSPVEQSAPF